MRSMLGVCVTASLVLCSCKGTTRQQPKEGSKEALLAVMDDCYKAVHAGDWDKVAALRHPREIRQMQALYRFNGEPWPPARIAAAGPARGVSDTFPDPANTRLEIDGDWARLLYEGPAFNSLALFNKVDGRWMWVTSVTDHARHTFDADGNCLDNLAFGISRLHVWPMKEERLWLPPVELSVRRAKDGADGLPRFEFHVRNAGSKPLTQWQLRAFFSSVSYRIDPSNAGRSSNITREFPKVLNPGEHLVLTDDVDLSLGRRPAPGKYTVRWCAGGYLSNEVSVEVK